MQRRELVAGLVSTIAAAPLFGLRLASAGQAEKVRRIGVLMGTPSNGDFLLMPFVEELALLWVGRTVVNVRFEQWWAKCGCQPREN